MLLVEEELGRMLERMARLSEVTVHEEVIKGFRVELEWVMT